MSSDSSDGLFISIKRFRELEEDIRTLQEARRRRLEERRKRYPEEEWRKWEEKRRKWEEEERKRWGEKIKFLQSEPTVNQLKAVDLSGVAHEWPSIAESLGVSSVAIKEVDNTIGCASTSCRIMLIKWLNHEKGTGNKERTWDAIDDAICSSVLCTKAHEFIEEAIGAKHMMQERIYAEIFRKTPTMQEIEELILHYLGEDWHRVGQLLRMSPKVMKEIGSKFGSFPTQCSEAMFSKWLNHEKGTGHKERTWGTVLTALEDAGRGDVAISVLDKLTAKHKEDAIIVNCTEEALKKAPNIKEIEVLVIPRVAHMWCAIGKFLGIIKAILIAIGSEARKKVSLKQSCEMFQLWLDGREGSGDEDRSWFVILRVFVDIGRSDIIFEIQERFNFKDKDIARVLSLFCDDTQSSSDDIIPVPTTPQEIADTASLVCPTLTNNVGQVSLHDHTEVDGEVEEDKGCYSKSLSESSGSEVYTVPLPRLGSKRSCSEGSMGESSHATVEESTSTHHPPQSNGDHFTWSEHKRRHLEKGLDKRGRFLSNQPARSRRIRQKLKKLNGLSNKSGLDKRRKCLGMFDLRGKSKKRKKNRRYLSEKSDLEITAASEFSAKKNLSKLSKSKQNKKIFYSNVPVEFVIKKLTRKKLCGAVKKMLNGQRIRVLCDDWGLVDETCRDIILGLLEKRNKVEAADQLIDYFKDTHTSKELLIFRNFLREEAGDGGRNPQLLKLAKSIEEAVYSASPED